MGELDLGGLAESGAKATAKYTVFHKTGADIVGKSVGDIRKEFARQWMIPPDADAMIGKQKVDEATVVKPGETLEFVKKEGEKGI